MATVEYSAELGARVAELVASGKTVSEACALEGIDRGTLEQWRLAHPDFDSDMILACSLLADHLVEDALTIVDTDPDARRAHNRAEARRWLAAALNPAYAQAQRLDVTIENREDMAEAIQAARARAGLSAGGRIIEGEVIAEPRALPRADTDAKR